MLTELTIKQAQKYCKDDISQIENYNEAIHSDERYCCHHKNGLYISHKKLKENNLYYNRPASELVFMEICAHGSLHNKGKHVSDETRQKMSDNHANFKGENNPMFGVHRYGANNPMYGKHLSNETRQKMSDTMSDGRRKGEKHPLAKQCTINGTTYGCLKDAYNDIKPNIAYATFTVKYKKGQL